MSFHTIISFILITSLYLLIIYEPKDYKSFATLDNLNKKIMITKALIIIIFVIINVSRYMYISILTFNYSNFILLLIIFLLFISIITTMIVYNKLKTKRIIKKLGIEYSYNRDIPDISITSAMFLNSKNISFNKSIKITILNLYYKGAIDIDFFDDKIKLSKTNNKLILKESEKYIYDYLFSSDKNNFSIKTWNNIIKQEIIDEDIGYEEKNNKYSKQYFIIFSIFFLPFTAYYLYKNLICMEDILNSSVILGITYSICPLIFIRFYEASNTYANINLTKKGYTLKMQIKALKKYLKDFTKMDEKDIKEIYIWREYLIFAQALNINYSHKKISDLKMKKLDDATLKDYIEKFIYKLTENKEEYY